MKIALCDDEKIFRDDIYRYIIKYNPDYEIREFPNGRALLNSREEFDIIFLDIEMPELNGMDTAAKLRNFSSDSIIIFLTSHIEKVQDAFKVRAFRFLTKPVQEDALKEAFTQAVKEISEQEKILINQKGRISEVKIDDIVYIAVNTFWEELEICLPELPMDKHWHMAVNTFDKEPVNKDKKQVFDRVTMYPRSVRVFYV